jgi:hypothetical protein
MALVQGNLRVAGVEGCGCLDTKAPAAGREDQQRGSHCSGNMIVCGSHGIPVSAHSCAIAPFVEPITTPG